MVFYGKTVALFFIWQRQQKSLPAYPMHFPSANISPSSVLTAGVFMFNYIVLDLTDTKQTNSREQTTLMEGIMGWSIFFDLLGLAVVIVALLVRSISVVLGIPIYTMLCTYLWQSYTCEALKYITILDHLLLKLPICIAPDDLAPKGLCRIIMRDLRDLPLP